jgi:hypothetical protein
MRGMFRAVTRGSEAILPRSGDVRASPTTKQDSLLSHTTYRLLHLTNTRLLWVVVGCSLPRITFSHLESSSHHIRTKTMALWQVADSWLIAALSYAK